MKNVRNPPPSSVKKKKQHLPKLTYGEETRILGIYNIYRDTYTIYIYINMYEYIYIYMETFLRTNFFFKALSQARISHKQN